MGRLLNVAMCSGCRAKMSEIDRLKHKVKRQARHIAELQKKLNATPRTANEAPFGRSTPPSKVPIKPGSAEEKRQRQGGARAGHKGHGRNVPAQADVTELLAPPPQCPDCGAAVACRDIRERTVLDVVPQRTVTRRFLIQSGCCKGCGRTVESPVPGVFPRAKYSNLLLAALAEQHYVQGRSQGEVCRQAGIGSGPFWQAMHTLADRLEPCAKLLGERFLLEPLRFADETSWRENGANRYAWLLSTLSVSLFLVGRSRAAEVPLELFQDLLREARLAAGVLVVDRWRNTSPSSPAMTRKRDSRSTVPSGLLHEPGAEVPAQGPHVDRLGRHAQTVPHVVAAAARGLSDQQPVGGPVAGAAEAAQVHERLGQEDPMPVAPLPVLGQLPQGQPQHMAGQMRNPHPWRNQEAHVVGHLVQVRGALGRAPADDAVAPGRLPGGGAEKQAGHRTPRAVYGQIRDALPDPRAEPKVVIGRQKRLPKAPFRSRVGRHQAYGQQVPQRTVDGRRPMRHRPEAQPPPVVHTGALARWQIDQAPAFQLQQQRPAGHVLAAARLVAPAPLLAELARQPGPVPVGVRPNQLAHQGHGFLRDRPALDDLRLLHTPTVQGGCA
jgi:hypothetical protein